MGSVWLLGTLAWLPWIASDALAQVSISAAPRAEALYSAEEEIDCSKLTALGRPGTDPLPFHVIRLTAEVPGAPPGARYQWSFPKKISGRLAADLDVGPDDQTSAVVGMCEEFGNKCLLTKDRLSFYSEPSILYVGPTCDALPKDTSKPFRGATDTIRLKVTDGKRKIGKAQVKVGFGHDGSITLFAARRTGQNQIAFDDGLGDRNGVSVFANPVFAANSSPPGFVPRFVEEYRFDSGGGTKETVPPPCTFASNFDACAQVTYPAPGTYNATVAGLFGDGSALCDNIKTQVVICAAKPRLEVTTNPKLDTYIPGDTRKGTVNVRVRLINASVREDDLSPCNFLLSATNTLTCNSEIKVGGVTDMKTRTFDLRHCSESVDELCDNDADCPSDERCLTEAHCSKTGTQRCASDDDCENTSSTGSPPACPTCEDDETCVHVLALGREQVFLLPGESVVLLDEQVTLRNDFTATAMMKDQWVGTCAIPNVSDGTLVKYKIKGQRRGQ